MRACLPSCAARSICVTIPTIGAIGKSWTAQAAILWPIFAARFLAWLRYPAMKPAPRCSIASTGTAHASSSASPEAGSLRWPSKSAGPSTAGACGLPKPRWTATRKQGFERGIGITHPLCEILAALSEPCLIVFDSFERYSPRAQRLAHRWMQTLLAENSPKHVHLLLTSQIEPAPKLIRGFIEAALPEALHRTTALDLPSADDVQSLVAPISVLQWASLRPELRPLLTNLKILDWLVAAVRSGKTIKPASIIRRQLSDGRAMGALGRRRYGPA